MQTNELTLYTRTRRPGPLTRLSAASAAHIRSACRRFLDAKRIRLGGGTASQRQRTSRRSCRETCEQSARLGRARTSRCVEFWDVLRFLLPGHSPYHLLPALQESLDDLVAKANRPNAQLSLDDLDIILAVRAMSGSWYCTLPANSPHPPYLETFATTYDSLTGGNRAPLSDPSHEMRHSQLCHRLLAHTVLYLRVDTIMQNLKTAQKKTPISIPDEARLLKQNYDALLEFASSARKEAPEWEVGQKLEANLQKYLADLGEADLAKALVGSS